VENAESVKKLFILSKDNGEFIIGIFLDLSKAFDTINQMIRRFRNEFYDWLL
jgi:hypothetical protein